MKKVSKLLLLIVVFGISIGLIGASGNRRIGVNVLLKKDPTKAVLADLGKYGRVLDVVAQIDAVTMKVPERSISTIRALPYVAAVNPDAKRNGAPVDTVPATDFKDGAGTWNLDALNVTEVWFSGRQIAEDGDGVYVAVLDTGLLDSWRQYFPEERIAEEYAIAFGGGGGEVGNVSTQPNKWEHDQNSHGTHVTSTILGYNFDNGGIPINGVAPMATIIPVKVLGQNGRSWSSVIARGITYIADLKAGPLADHPVVINMSLGGPVLDAVEKAAIDYAISKGVIIVASAGDSGEKGMGYPGAYEPVISVAAAGWKEINPDEIYWWVLQDVADPTKPAEFYIADFSSREKPGQDLDVTAPGVWIFGPYQLQSGKLSYYFLSGTSMASPHVAGVVALMAQKHPGLTAADAELYLETSALPMGSTVEAGAGLVTADAALDAIP